MADPSPTPLMLVYERAIQPKATATSFSVTLMPDKSFRTDSGELQHSYPDSNSFSLSALSSPWSPSPSLIVYKKTSAVALSLSHTHTIIYLMTSLADEGWIFSRIDWSLQCLMTKVVKCWISLESNSSVAFVSITSRHQENIFPGRLLLSLADNSSRAGCMLSLTMGLTRWYHVQYPIHIS